MESIRREGTIHLILTVMVLSLIHIWRMEQEKWIQQINWINQLKLRVGYGVTGNSAVNPCLLYTSHSIITEFACPTSETYIIYIGSIHIAISFSKPIHISKMCIRDSLSIVRSVMEKLVIFHYDKGSQSGKVIESLTDQ